MIEFFDLAELFYQILAYYFLLIEHEEAKHREEFQQMIYDNLVVADEAEKLMGVASKLKS